MADWKELELDWRLHQVGSLGCAFAFELFSKNYVSMNIYYKELVYSHIQQNQGSNLVVLLSKIISLR